MATSVIDSAAAGAEPAATPVVHAQKRAHPSRVVVLSGVYGATLIGLVVLRAVVDDMGFISMGWLFVLALLPILPWLIPQIAPVVARLAPNVESLKLPGGFEIALRSAARAAPALGAVENVLTQDHLAQGLVASPTPFTTTDAMTVADGVQAVRATGSATAVVDLSTGMKWRLPNLYFLAWLIANEPVLHWLVFVEMAGNTPGVYVGVAGSGDVCRRIEEAYPQYAQVAPQLEYFDVRTKIGVAPALVGGAQPLGPMRDTHLSAQFNAIRSGVAIAGDPEAPTLAWVDTAMLRDILGPDLGTESVPWSGDMGRDELRRLARSPVPYIGATSPDGRLRGLLDQRDVLVEFTRRALEDG